MMDAEREDAFSSISAEKMPKFQETPKETCFSGTRKEMAWLVKNLDFRKAVFEHSMAKIQTYIFYNLQVT